LTDQLPTIQVPLKRTSEQVGLDLQAAFTRVFDESFYTERIYSSDPVPPLTAEQQRWAGQLPALPN